MSEPKRPPSDVGPVLKFFPEDSALVARMYAESADFRGICEDLILADGALVRLETLRPDREPAKIAEYRQLVAELRKEIAAALERYRPI
jgi:hypothetical protein